MPQELPGFYYDEEKNRYFPIKGPIPGSSRPSSSSSSSSNNVQKAPSNPTQVRTRVGTSKLLQGRELNGNIISSLKRKFNFMEEFHKALASTPVVWKYQETVQRGDSALDQVRIELSTPEGRIDSDCLLAGSVNGSLSLFELGQVGQHDQAGINCIPDRVWTVREEDKVNHGKSPGHIRMPSRFALSMPSPISCIKTIGNHHLHSIADSQRALISTLGSESHGGLIYILSLVEPLDFESFMPIRRMLRKVASFNCTIWTVDCTPNASNAVIGTNAGAAMVNLETGTQSWVCRSKSDVLSQQLDQSGNVVLCGLRNGVILMVDVRENQQRYPRLVRHRIPHSRLHRPGQNSYKQWFEVKGNIHYSSTKFMPSSVCSLVSLRSYEQYFLASSMDGTIKLYDHRMAKRGAIQSYEGHVNSHSRLQLGVDQSERFLMAGGEDGNVRLWSIKSGELLFEERISHSVLTSVCWQRAERCSKEADEGERLERSCGTKNSLAGAWLGSQEGLFYMQW